MTLEQVNARLAFAVFPHLADAQLTMSGGRETRQREWNVMAVEARALGWRMSACGEPIAPKGWQPI